MCIAASNHVLKEGINRLIICDSLADNTSIRREGIITLFHQLIYGSAKHLFIKTTDRISRECSPLWDLLIGLCDRANVSISTAGQFGAPIKQLVQSDVNKRIRDRKTNTTYQECIAEMFCELDEDKRIASWASVVTGENFSCKRRSKEVSTSSLKTTGREDTNVSSSIIELNDKASMMFAVPMKAAVKVGSGRAAAKSRVNYSDDETDDDEDRLF
jgi:hypothetical protein